MKFMELVHTSLGKHLPGKKAGKFILALAWRAEKLRSMLTGSIPILTKEAARHANTHLSYTNAKIKKTLGMNFIPVSHAVKDTAKYFLSDQHQGQK